MKLWSWGGDDSGAAGDQQTEPELLATFQHSYGDVNELQVCEAKWQKLVFPVTC